MKDRPEVAQSMLNGVLVVSEGANPCKAWGRSAQKRPGPCRPEVLEELTQKGLGFRVTPPRRNNGE